MAFSFFRKKDDSCYQELEDKYKKNKEDLKKQYKLKIQKLEEELKQKLTKLKANFEKKLGVERIAKRKNEKNGELDKNIFEFINLLIKNKLLNEESDAKYIKELGSQLREKNIDEALEFLELKYNIEEINEEVDEKGLNFLKKLNGKAYNDFLSKVKDNNEKILRKVKKDQFIKLADKIKSFHPKEIKANENLVRSNENSLNFFIDWIYNCKINGTEVSENHHFIGLRFKADIAKMMIQLFNNIRGLIMDYGIDNDDKLKNMYSKLNNVLKTYGVTDAALKDPTQLDDPCVEFAKKLTLNEIVCDFNEKISNLQKIK